MIAYTTNLAHLEIIGKNKSNHVTFLLQTFMYKGLFGSNRKFKWPFREMVICPHQTLFPNRNYARWLAARSCTYRTFIAATSHICYQSLLTMRKDRAQWNDIKDLFMIQHLLKATRQGKKNDSGFKKEVRSELQRNVNTKFGVSLVQSNFTYGDCDGTFGCQGRKLDIFGD
jgi:hypothetical protein